MNNTQLIVITDAVVARGQAAWGRIKATAEEQRELWRRVGEALNVGRKLNPSNQAFGKWCKEMGFDMNPSVRSNAMWYALNHASCNGCKTDGHPTAIRQWFNEQPKEPLPADLQDTQVEVKSIPSMDQKTAEKVAKLANRAKSGDEGSEIAQRHLESPSTTKVWLDHTMWLAQNWSGVTPNLDTAENAFSTTRISVGRAATIISDGWPIRNGHD